MREMYGNVNSEDGRSRLRLSPTKEGLQSKFHGELMASPLLDAAYVEGGIPRHLLVTAALPVARPWDCRPCTSLVGAAVFSRIADRWSLTAHNIVLAEAGEFAENFRADLQPLGPDHFGFRLEHATSGGGEGIAFSVFDISGSEIQEVLSGDKDSSFMRDKCWPMPLSQAWTACVEFTGGISVVPGDDPQHYDIVQARHVTRSVTRRIPRGTYLFRYQYLAGEYVLKEPNPTKSVAYDSRPWQSNGTRIAPSSYYGWRYR
jgi:hypothetical protein